MWSFKWFKDSDDVITNDNSPHASSSNDNSLHASSSNDNSPHASSSNDNSPHVSYLSLFFLLKVFKFTIVFKIIEPGHK